MTVIVAAIITQVSSMSFKNSLPIHYIENQAVAIFFIVYKDDKKDTHALKVTRLIC